MDRRDIIIEALRLLGIRNLVLAIHDASFPGTPDEDTGRGSPYTHGGLGFLRFVRELGFNGILLGPQGQTTEANASPYDGTVFSKSTLSIALHRLVDEEPWAELLSRKTFESLVASRPPGSDRRVSQRYAARACRQALQEVHAAFLRQRERQDALAARFEAFWQESAPWLERDALYEALMEEHGGAAWMYWPEEGEAGLDRRLWSPRPGEEAACEQRKRALRRRHEVLIERYALGQFLVHEQHRRLREAAAALGLKLFGDLQIGFSVADTWSYRPLFMERYVMGAPPSRTNPEGQPWNYPVLDPRKYLEGGRPGPALRLMSARMDKMLSEFDGVRLDHPHGLVCPWVYRANEPDPLRAVQGGARLFSSPDLPDHPELAELAIVTRRQLNPSPGVPRHADDWVLVLTPEQVDRYAILFDVIVESARRHGRQLADIICEVLSTFPFPLRAVVARYGLGRFRVTQKADLANPADVYRSENAAVADWVMAGTHDTPPLWLLLERWQAAGTMADQARYLASRLCPEGQDPAALARELAMDAGKLAQAKLADLFACRAENVMVFFTDLLGMKEIYNAPGTVSEDNWTLRVPPDYEREYRERLLQGRALNLPGALALALRAQGKNGANRDLIAQLESSLGGELRTSSGNFTNHGPGG